MRLELQAVNSDKKSIFVMGLSKPTCEICCPSDETTTPMQSSSMINASSTNGSGNVKIICSESINLGNIMHTSRTKLPAPMLPRNQISIWNILRNCIGKELSKITMPVEFNEPLTMLQRAVEGVQYSQFLQLADQSENPIERMEYVCAFIIAGLSANCHRIIKPFNPLLYETYELDYELEDGSRVRTMSQQVSHHPPITAVYSDSDYFIYNGSVNPKIRFTGKSVDVQPDGQCRVYLKHHNETYVFKSVSCSVHNIIIGKLWFEHKGPLDIHCIETNVQANLSFKQAGWFSNDLHRFDGVIVSGDEKLSKEVRKARYVYGKWSDYIKSASYSDYVTHKKADGESLDIPSSRTLWKLESQYMEEYYNFTSFTMRLNEITPELAETLPRTDSRFRPDVRKLEEGDIVGAANEKQRLEEKQREVRSRDKRFKDPSPELLWFDLKSLPFSKEKFWMYKGDYWENKCNEERFPNLF